jgi:hypothetical protein
VAWAVGTGFELGVIEQLKLFLQKVKLKVRDGDKTFQGQYRRCYFQSLHLWVRRHFRLVPLLSVYCYRGALCKIFATRGWAAGYIG